MLKFLQSFYIVLYTLFLTILNAPAQNVTADSRENKSQRATSTSAGQSKFTFIIINDSQSGFGYDIFSNNKKIIHQPTVPGASGNSGFFTKENAVKVAKLVIKKLQNNIMPPTITRQELDSLHIKP